MMTVAIQMKMILNLTIQHMIQMFVADILKPSCDQQIFGAAMVAIIILVIKADVLKTQET